MPEGLEAEIYRRAADAVVGRRIERVEVDERQLMAVELGRELPGRTIVGTQRHGKVVLIELDDGGGPRALGLHFGMTGRLVVDGSAAIDELAYSSRRDDPAWDRLVIGFQDRLTMRVNDPRRWAVFTLDPDIARLGPDFLTIGAPQFAERLRGRRATIKAVLLDQTVVAGYGNLCVDEVLWQAGVSPLARVNELAEDRVAAIVRAAIDHLPAMLARGGSHTGTISPEVRAVRPPCPREGAPLRRDTVAGRTTVWCPVHQTV